MFTFTRTSIALGIAALVFTGAAQAADDSAKSNTRRVSFIPSANAAIAPPGQSEPRLPAAIAGEALVFSAPPRESAEEAYRLYEPVAAYLSRVIGRPVAYKHPRSWLSYQKEMANGNFDIVFDESHFNSWRVSNLQHNMLAKIADEHAVAVIVRKDNAKFTDLKQLAGKKVCGIDPSNLETLAFLNEFGTLRQPLVVNSASWSKVYEGLVEDRCVASVMPVAMLRKFDGNGNATRTIHRSRTLPNQAFSAGPRLSNEEQQKLANALVSAEGRRALQGVLSAFGADKGLALAFKDEYAGMDAYLKNVWGYTR